MEEINKATISRLETEIHRLREMIDRRDAEYDRLCTRFEALEESQTMTNLIELKMHQSEKDFEQAKRINKEIDKRVTHWEESIRLLKQCIGYLDQFQNETYVDDINYFLRKVNEL